MKKLILIGLSLIFSLPVLAISTDFENPTNVENIENGTIQISEEFVLEDHEIHVYFLMVNRVHEQNQR